MERIFEKYGWVIYLALGILWLVVGLTQVFNPDALLENEAQHVAGMSMNELEASSPEATRLAYFLIGAVGVLKTSWSIFLIAIAITAFRKGEKWAWYTMWLAPVTLVGQGVFNSVFFGDISEMIQWIPITTISLLGLFVPYRKFFPKEA
jgi:hypothetical protein